MRVEKRATANRNVWLVELHAIFWRRSIWIFFLFSFSGPCYTYYLHNKSTTDRSKNSSSGSTYEQFLRISPPPRTDATVRLERKSTSAKNQVKSIAIVYLYTSSRTLCILCKQFSNVNRFIYIAYTLQSYLSQSHQQQNTVPAASLYDNI